MYSTNIEEAFYRSGTLINYVCVVYVHMLCTYICRSTSTSVGRPRCEFEFLRTLMFSYTKIALESVDVGRWKKKVCPLIDIPLKEYCC